MKVTDLMTPQEIARLKAREGPVYVAWELASRWLSWWRDGHPEDDRDDVRLLTDVYGAVEWDD